MSKTFFLAITLFLSLSVTAQDTTGTQLDEVVVTANKFSTKTSATGKVVTVITQQDLAHAGSKDLAQVLTEQGGMYLNGAFSNAGKDKSVYLRGAKVDHTLITIDGVPVYDASGIGSNFDIRLIPIESVERIEILRGSQSTLYGSDAIAGVINIITKKNTGKTIGGSGVWSYGSYNSLRTAATVHGLLKKFDYNLGADYFKTDGISEAQRVPSGYTYDNDGFSQKGVQARVGIQVSNGVRIEPYLRYSKIRGALDQQAFVDEKDFDYTTENLQTGVRNEFSMGGSKLNLIYNYNHTNRAYLDDSTESRNGYYLFNKAGYKAAEHFAEAYIVAPLSAKLKATAGLDFRSSNTDYDAVAVSPSFDPDFPAPVKSVTAQSGDSVHQKQVGFYSALHFSDDHFGAEVGSRFNHHSVYGTNVASNINAFYRMAQWKLFANISSGYKTPSLYQLYSEYGNKNLKPEDAINIEGGLQYFLRDATGSVRATYFYRDVRDVSLFFTNPDTYQSQYINQDRQKDQGVEVESKIEIVRGLDVKLFYTYVDGKITTKTNGKDTTYFNLLRRPKSALTVTLGYNFFKHAYLSFGANRFGRRSDVYYDASFVRHDIVLKSYTLINVYAEYGLLKKAKLFADLRNVFGKRYAEIYGYSAPRFNGYGGVRLSF